jgi:hypothetical protein
MAIALVASLTAQPGPGGGTTSAITTTGASLIVISVSWYFGLSGSPTTVTDNKGNTYTGLTFHTSSNFRHRFFYALAPTVGTGHAFTITGSNFYPAIFVYAFSDVASYQTESGAGLGSGTSVACGSVTPSASGALVLTALASNQATASLTPSGFTVALIPNTGGTSAQGGFGYLVQSPAAAINPTWAFAAAEAGVSAAVFLATAAPVQTVRVTQDAIEVLALAPVPVRVTQDAVEVIALNTVPARVTQYALEVLSAPFLGWRVFVDGVDQTARVTACSIVWTINERTRATVVFNDYLPDRLAEIVSTEKNGITPLFGGVILSRHVEGYTQAAPDLKVTCECGDYFSYADWVSVSASYAAAPLKTVLIDLVASLSAYGITLDAAQAEGPTLAPVTWTQKKVSAALRELSAQTGYFLRMRPDKVLSMAPPGGEAAPDEWTDTLPAHVQEVDWRDLETVPANKVVLTCGPNGLATIADEHHWGDGGTRIFPLNSPYVAIVGALRTGSDPGGLDPGGFPVGTYGVDDLAWTYDGSLNAMRQRTDQPILAADEYIMLWYSAQFPFTVSADTGATPVIEYHDARPELLSIPTAQQIAEEMLVNMSGDPTTLHGRFDEDGYQVGQLLTVSLSGMRAIAGTFTIQSVTLNLVLDDYWRYELEAKAGALTAPSHLAGWRQIIGEGYAIPGPWETPPAVRSGTGTMPSTIISAGTAAALGGPAFLGGTREGSIRLTGMTWEPVFNYIVYYAGVTFSAIVRADLSAARAGVSVQARLWNVTEGRSVGESIVVTSTTPVSVIFPVTIEFGNKYRLEKHHNGNNEIIYCLGTLEAT